MANTKQTPRMHPRSKDTAAARAHPLPTMKPSVASVSQSQCIESDTEFDEEKLEKTSPAALSTAPPMKGGKADTSCASPAVSPPKEGTSPAEATDATLPPPTVN